MWQPQDRGSSAANYEHLKAAIDQVLAVKEQIREGRLSRGRPGRARSYQEWDWTLARVEAAFSSATEGSRVMASRYSHPRGQDLVAVERVSPTALQGGADVTSAPTRVPLPRVRESGHG